ncbi:hypothetical protein [Flavobacterium microcysteis]
MNRKILKFIFSYLQVHLFAGIFNALMLIYLVLTDPYFYNLDFKANGFTEKYEYFLLMTFTIPLILTIFFCAYQIIKSNLKSDKIILTITSILGIVTFIYFDKFLKKALFFFGNVLLSISIITMIYIVLFLLAFKLEKKFTNTSI